MRLKFQKVAGNMDRGMEYRMSAGDGTNEELDGVIQDFAQDTQPRKAQSRTSVRASQNCVYR